MDDTLYNLVSAVAIGILIGLMAIVRDPRKKALIYSLPIPITIALIVTHGHVNSSNIIGLVLICAYLVLVHKLRDTYKVHIIAADILGALAYIFVGYFAVTYIHLNFMFASSLYVAGWACVMLILRHRPTAQHNSRPSKISPLAKGAVTSVVAFVLFNLKRFLAGIVVTFPYSGVFAVIETQDNLQTLARVVARNSIAILGLFVTLYYTQSWLHLYAGLAVSWLAFLAILKMAQKLPV